MRILAFWVMFSFFNLANAQSVPSIAEFELKLGSNQGLPLSDEIAFELSNSNATAIMKNLQNWPDIKTTLLDSNRLLINMKQRPQHAGNVSSSYLQDSFVIDLSEKSTTEFTSGFKINKTLPIELHQLEAYVDQYIDKPTYVNGFHIASIVATQRSGDCTEYAVLLTALARSLDLPARVIIGTVIVEQKDKVTAFGHAWVEVWHDEQWHIMDAALHQSKALKHFYLPSTELEKEGPGYNMSLVKSIVLLPNKISELQDAN